MIFGLSLCSGWRAKSPAPPCATCGMRTLGVRNYDCAVIAIGGDLATSVVATLNLKELGVQSVVCKATDETQRRALEKIGADHVVVPERESGIKLAQSLTSSSILDFIELSPDCGIAELQTPSEWCGKSGMTMRKKMPTSLQPSIMAASSSSRETEKEK